MTRISMGLLSATISILKTIDQHHINKKHDLISYMRINYVDMNQAFKLALECSWIGLGKDSLFYLTENGSAIINGFDGRELPPSILRSMLYAYATSCTPIWVFRVPSGRKEASLFMSSDEKRCFFEAGLLETLINDSCIKWWDTLASEIRSTKDIKLLETGRKAERLSIQYEKYRTGLTPDWRSFDTNLAGYDVLSVLDKGNRTKLLIEVKASELPLDEAKMIITSHEWNVAMQSLNYSFYLWSLQKIPILGIVSIYNVLPHIPQNMGNGIWGKVQIPFCAFQDCFADYESLSKNKNLYSQ